MLDWTELLANCSNKSKLAARNIRGPALDAFESHNDAMREAEWSSHYPADEQCKELATTAQFASSSDGSSLMTSDLTRREISAKSR
jgi:hypothetical protein